MWFSFGVIVAKRKDPKEHHHSTPVLALFCLFLLLAASAHAWTSSLVQVDAQGRLSYPADASGNRIPDFSNAGYRGGGVPLPTNIPVVGTLSPTAGDQTARIQAAIDAVNALPVQANGYRGTLRLSAGVWEVVGVLRLRASGVVLAGVGAGDDPAANTILRRTGTAQDNVIQAGVRYDSYKSEVPNSRAQITTPRVPVGSRSFEVDHPEYYRVGDAVILWHPSTQAWLDAVDRGGVTDANYWRPGEIDLRYHRYITGISGSTITVDAPVFNLLDRGLSQSTLFKYDSAHILRNLGIEKLQVEVMTAGEFSEDHAEDAIAFVGAEDSWIRDCTMKHFWHAGVQWEGSTRCTAERCRSVEPHSIVDGSRRYNFSMYQSQLILVQDCFADRARHAYVCNGTSLDSGIVFLNCVTDRALTSSEGHRRWSTGLLYDGLVATNRQNTDILGLYNRGTYGTGHGWAAAHSVAWNCNASTGGRIWIQRPPTAQNYGIGCTGNITGTGPFAGPAGHIEGSNQAGLEPRSLYLAQLAQRLADASAPAITAAPASRTITPGDTTIFTVAATGANLTYEWSLNGKPIAGATTPTLTVANASSSQEGAYTVTVNGKTTASATLAVTASANPGRLTNLAIRSTAGTGAQTLILGASLTGGTGSPQPLLLRAMGPSLAPFGVTGALADPALTLYSGTTVLAANDDWGGGASLANAAAQAGAFAFMAPTSRDAALLQPGLGAGSYSLHVTAASGASGVALAEIYETPSAAASPLPSRRLANLSARTQAGTGASLLIAGFTLGGTTSKTVLLRAVGPGLASFGVTGFLADPKLELFSGATLVASNDNWDGTPALTTAFAAVGAFALPAASRDGALLVSLAPGGYTAQVSGVANATGVALVEVYVLNP